ncbi:hypothetical protein RhiirA1_486326, partial [Rhizophagus irregularis]
FKICNVPQCRKSQLFRNCLFAAPSLTAIYSAVEGYVIAERLTADRRNMLATSISEHVTSMDLKQQKRSKKQKSVIRSNLVKRKNLRWCNS